LYKLQFSLSSREILGAWLEPLRRNILALGAATTVSWGGVARPSRYFARCAWLKRGASRFPQRYGGWSERI